MSLHLTDIGREIAKLGDGRATVTTAPMYLYVDATLGSDANPGTEELPLKTLIRAEQMIPDFVNHPVFIFVANGTYVGPTFRARVMRADIYVYCEEFNELLSVQTVASGSSKQSLTAAPGLGVDTYRGKTIEILSGAAKGDLREIHSHTDTVLKPCVAFSGNVVTGDQWRVLEPVATITQPAGADALYLVAGQGSAPVKTYGHDGPVRPGVVVANFKLDVETLNCDAVCRLYGCETTGAFSVGGSRGVLFIGWDGNERGDFTSQPASTGLAFGAVSKTSWSGWGLNCATWFISQEEIDISALCLVTNGILWASQGSHLLVHGGSIRNPTPGGIATVYVTGTAGDSTRPTVMHVSGKTLFVDVILEIVATDPNVGCLAWGHSAYLHLEQCTINATGKPAIKANARSVIHVAADVHITGSSDGYTAVQGGRVQFRTGATIVASGNQVSVGNTPTVGTLATNFTVDGAYLAEGDGSVVQRVS